MIYSGLILPTMVTFNVGAFRDVFRQGSLICRAVVQPGLKNTIRNRVWHLVWRLLGMETFFIFWEYRYRSRKISVSVSVSKIFGPKKSLGIGLKNLGLKKSFSISYKNLGLKKVSVLVSKDLVSKKVSVMVSKKSWYFTYFNIESESAIYYF